jgi:glycosyltransferase involved in cell wall biosynthesis
MTSNRVTPRTPTVLHARVVRGAGGGPDKTILNSPRSLLGSGYRVLCAYLHPPGDPGFEQLRDKARLWGAPLLPIPDRGPLDWQVLPQLLAICRKERVSVWHGHDYKSNLLGLLLRRFWPMRLVTTVHGWVQHTRRTPLYYWIDRICLPRYERVICVSEDLAEQSVACGVPPDRCVLIENAIDTAEFSRRLPVEEAKKRLGIPPGRLVVGAVGRLSAEKGFDLLIRSVARLLKRGMDLELVIVGEGDQQAPLQALVESLGAGERIQLLGYRSDTRGVYEALDLFALSSLREGLPNVLLEAMALETPVVATRIAGIPRLIRDGENGLLVEPGDEDALTQGLTRLLEDAELRARFRSAGRRTVEARYSFEVRMQKVRALYDGLLQADGALAPSGLTGRGAPPAGASRRVYPGGPDTRESIGQAEDSNGADPLGGRKLTYNRTGESEQAGRQGSGKGGTP